MANESLSLSSTQRAGGVIGAYGTVGTSTHLSHRSGVEVGAGSTAGSGTGLIVAKIVATGTAATAGRTRVVVIYGLGGPTDVTAV